MYLELTILDGKKAEKTVEDLRRIVARTGGDSRKRTAADGEPRKRARK